jgi:hypothetical protein
MATRRRPPLRDCANGCGRYVASWRPCVLCPRCVKLVVGAEPGWTREAREKRETGAAFTTPVRSPPPGGPKQD